MLESKQNKQHNFYIKLKLNIFLENCNYASCIFYHLQLINSGIIQADYFLIITIWNTSIGDFLFIYRILMERKWYKDIHCL